MLSDPLARFVETVRADEADGEEVVGRAETACGKVALWESGQLQCVLFFLFIYVFIGGWVCMSGRVKTDLVLYGLVAAGWREVLTHGFEG